MEEDARGHWRDTNHRKHGRGEDHENDRKENGKGSGGIKAHTNKAGLTKIPLFERMTETGSGVRMAGEGTEVLITWCWPQATNHEGRREMGKEGQERQEGR